MQLNCNCINARKLLGIVATLLLVKAVVVVFLSYRDYFPPNFNSEFLFGRDFHFWGWYCIAFYVHVITGPLALIIGRLLISPGLRNRNRRAHRILGRAQVAIVLLGVAPSGLGMSFYAESGAWAGSGFALLALATGGTVFLGWRAAMARRFVAHQQWMERCFWLLCSAIVLRMLGGLSGVFNLDSPWAYPVSAWLSWLGPLSAYELVRFHSATGARSTARKIATSVSSLKPNKYPSILRRRRHLH